MSFPWTLCCANCQHLREVEKLRAESIEPVLGQVPIAPPPAIPYPPAYPQSVYGAPSYNCPFPAYPGYPPPGYAGQFSPPPMAETSAERPQFAPPPEHPGADNG
jgi:hypothetical protein